MIEVEKSSLQEIKKEYTRLYNVVERQNHRINQLKDENIKLLSENVKLKYELEKTNEKN